MKGICIITIAFLAPWTINAANLHQITSNEESYVDIPTVCPLPERFPENTTTNIPHESDCTKFYKCLGGKGILQDCPLMIDGDPITRLHYNRRLQVCDWPSQAGCISCPPKDRNGVFPPPSKINHETNCEYYYECINDVPHLRNCPAGTCFSRTCQECVADWNGGNCDPNRFPGINPDRCEIPSDNGNKKSHHCHPGLYCICVYPDWILQECEGGLHFSPKTRTCVPADEAV